MAHLIDKDALVAKINESQDAIKKYIFSIPLTGREIADAALEHEILRKIKGLLSTLEVKEINLDEDVDRILKEYNWNYNKIDFYNFARHFFELGICVNNPITAADRGTADEIIISLKRVEKDYRIDLTKEKNWVLNKVQKGDKI